jgi:(2Fe-2S) ferredoxin
MREVPALDSRLRRALVFPLFNDSAFTFFRSISPFLWPALRIGTLHISPLVGLEIDRGRAGCEPAGVPLRQHYLFVCTNRRSPEHGKGSCADKGSEEVRLALKDQLAARGLATFQARSCASSCLDQCSSGVCLLVEPDHFFYGRVTLADVPEIVEAIVNGRRVERLVLLPADLARG